VFLLKGIAFVFNGFWWWVQYAGGAKEFPLFLMGVSGGLQYVGEGVQRNCLGF